MVKSTQDTLNAYWNKSTASPEFMGVYPMGTGCELEVPYRHYWELQTVLPHLPEEPFSLLELACGAGRWAFSLAPRLTSYIGVDISAPQINVAREITRSNGRDNFDFRLGDAMDFEAPPASFDVIFLGSCSMYVDDDSLRLLLDRVRTWLKPGGLLIEHATTFVGETRYIRHDDTYCAIYRLPHELVGLVAAHGFTYTHDERSYPFLRGPRSMWRNPELALFIRWCSQNEPEKMFSLMKDWSDSISAQQGPYIYEGDKTYDHRVFFFTAP